MENEQFRIPLGRIISALVRDKRVKKIRIWSNTVTFDIEPGYWVDDISKDLAGSSIMARRSDLDCSGGAYSLYPDADIERDHFWVPSEFYSRGTEEAKQEIALKFICKQYKPWPYPKARSETPYVVKEKLNMELIGDILGCF